MLSAALLAGCGRSDAPVTPEQPRLSAEAELGKILFFDTLLSASGKLACASCHDPAHAYGPPDGASVRLGGEAMNLMGGRAVPSLRYKQYTPLFSLHAYLPKGGEMEDAGPAGGFTQDGRAATLADQAAIPLLDSKEMANASPEAVIERLRASPSAGVFKKVHGDQSLDDVATAFTQLTHALQVFQLEDQSFHPYSSKYDRVLNKAAVLTEAEGRGMKLFFDPNKGNCADCHTAVTGPGGRHPDFTNFAFNALGVPRNAAIPANQDAAYFDMGLCGPMRQDQWVKDRPDLCGMFKTPTLRNVAARGVFFHNGALHSLDDVLAFYATRDTDPDRWYPRKAGKVDRFNDLPASLRKHVDTHTPPFDRQQGDRPVLDTQEIADLKAFIETLVDADVRAVSPPATSPARPVH
ncbi:cytochrome-c peroxidase [Burkholderiaceae bacterium DAT-1]|nr:cytochrome-c peroxidase [Burkholderiaceae bacterium DAT-1]